MWRRRNREDVVALSLVETQEARTMISESNDLLNDIGRELNDVLTSASRALLTRGETQGA